MSFRNLDIQISYRTRKQDPIEEFFKPVLSSSRVYNVAVGYFSSNWIRDNSHGIARFAQNKGKAHWIISPFDLNKEDRLMLIDAYKSKKPMAESVEKIVSYEFERLFEQLQGNTRTAISWLIRDGIVDFKMGIPTSEDGVSAGILHSKMGYFEDVEGNQLSFSGSYNLTGQARYNWERFDVFKAWESDRDKQRTQEIKDDLEKMWRGEDDSLAIFEPTETTLRSFINHTTSTTRPYQLPQKPNEISNQEIRIPLHFLSKDGTLRDYQEQAINNWLKNNGRGVFHMATGSGKTATALSAITRLHNLIVKKKKKSFVIVVSVPFVSLADQWVSEAEEFNFDVVACYGSRNSWLETFQNALQAIRAKKNGYIFVVTVNRSFTGSSMQSLLKSIRGDFLFVGDEMHNLGAESNLRCLPENANFRIGLSATPDREYDEEGTNKLEAYFGKEVIEFTIKDALERGYLCKYYYYPVLVDLTDAEWSDYLQISREISKVFSRESGKKNKDPSPYLQNLIFKRARLVGKAENKIEALIDRLKEYQNSSHVIVYCGDAKDGDLRQVDIVTGRITSELGMRVNKFTSEEPNDEREEILSNFKSGNTQALIAIKCLDEGIDIPKTNAAFILASSSSKRQFIQRRGRVLRKAPGKDYAYLYDFIAVPRFDKEEYDDAEALMVERQLFSKELERVNEFSLNALNSGDTLKALRSIKQRLNLMDM